MIGLILKKGRKTTQNFINMTQIRPKITIDTTQNGDEMVQSGTRWYKNGD